MENKGIIKNDHKEEYKITITQEEDEMWSGNLEYKGISQTFESDLELIRLMDKLTKK